MYFAGKEWQKKATGKMIMMIVVAAVLFVLTLDPQTVLQPVGQKLFEMIGAK
ncbi:TcpD family membrane protein [Lactococcus lactis]|uniref:TcpD family membrane protein n=1 Tax=Lactococcus lactis TaxID=1358 RepID=UPI00288FEAF1|nr:TcpD family membrane protein [Lactococcus lactis]MDT2893435.1 TcpD family membrane protein [Lactococcus lactis]